MANVHAPGCPAFRAEYGVCSCGAQRRSGHSRLVGQPLDDDGAIKLSVQDESRESFQKPWVEHAAGLELARKLVAAEQREREMALGFLALWESAGVQDADNWLYILKNRAHVITDDDDCREAQDNTPSLGPFK